MLPRRRIFVNAALSAVQQRNLQAAWGIPVVDRTGLIIDIFAQRALSREANLQVSAEIPFSTSCSCWTSTELPGPCSSCSWKGLCTGAAGVSGPAGLAAGQNHHSQRQGHLWGCFRGGVCQVPSAAGALAVLMGPAAPDDCARALQRRPMQALRLATAGILGRPCRLCLSSACVQCRLPTSMRTIADP